VLILQRSENPDISKFYHFYFPSRNQISEYGNDPFQYSDYIKRIKEESIKDILRRMNFSAMYVNLDDFIENVFRLFMQKSDMRDEYVDFFMSYP